MTARRTSRLTATITLGLLLALGSACAPPRQLVPMSANPQATTKVLVLKSSNNALYDAPTQSFMKQLSDVSNVYVETAGGEEVARSITALQPTLVLALGTKAALFARETLPTTPVLFAMVLNYKRHKALETPLSMGVALEVPPYVELVQFKLPLQNMRKVLVIHNPANTGALVAEAQKVAANIGLELITAAAKSPDEVAAAFANNVSLVDSVWLLNDPVVMNPKSFAFLRDASLKNGKVLVSSLSDEFARAGALLSVSVDLTSLGFQAASLARSVLEKTQRPDEIGVQPPIGARLVLNMTVAKKLGLAIPDEVMPLINEVILTER